MEAAGTVPRVGVEVDDLAKLLDGEGPFLTVHLVTDGAVENAAQRSEQRWRTLRQRLADEGAPETALDLVDPLVAEAHQQGATLLVVADADSVRHIQHLDEPLDDDRGSWSRLPGLVPLVRWRQDHPPYVVVLADRGGADLIGDRPGRADLERTVGDGEPERKVHGGGWSHRRFQQRAEEDWAKTAAEVAEAVVRLADRVDPRILVLGGDVRATNLILGDLPAELAQRTRLIEQGRAADGSEEERDREVRRLVATAVAEDTVALLDKFREERGQHDRAADGIEATVDALNQAAVDVLLLHDDADHTAWVGPQPVPLGLDRATASVGADEEPVEARLADALLRAAVGTGATVRIVPAAGPVRDGVGALLRWAAPTT
jgi:peptide subunit release factor 1 (eRF1)